MQLGIDWLISKLHMINISEWHFYKVTEHIPAYGASKQITVDCQHSTCHEGWNCMLTYTQCMLYCMLHMNACHKTLMATFSMEKHLKRRGREWANTYLETHAEQSSQVRRIEGYKWQVRAELNLSLLHHFPVQCIFPRVAFPLKKWLCVTCSSPSCSLWNPTCKICIVSHLWIKH